MLWAVLHDFERCREVETVTLVHERFEQLPPGEVQRVRTAAEEEEWFRDHAAGADATLVIAPETANLLEDRARWVGEVGGRLLGSTTEAIALTADKLRCGQWWRQHHVPTPAVRGLDGAVVYPAVLKPRDGAGSQATFLVRNAEELANGLQQADAEGRKKGSGPFCRNGPKGASHKRGLTPFSAPRDVIVQDHVAGQPASVAFLLGPHLTVPLPPAAQLLSSDGRFRYLGGTVPLPSRLRPRAVALGRRAIDAIPGLRGYVGVDLVLGDNPDGSGDWAIEINPRLTTSYIGLRMLAQDNLALAMLRVTLGENIGKLRWREEVIRFAPDGALETWPASRYDIPKSRSGFPA